MTGERFRGDSSPGRGCELLEIRRRDVRVGEAGGEDRSLAHEHVGEIIEPANVALPIAGDHRDAQPLVGLGQLLAL